MEERTSIIKLLGLPETFVVLLLTFGFVLLLAPYFSGADFGLFKIPQFTDSARKKLKIIGPIIFLVLVMLFIPLIPRQVSTTHGNGNRGNAEDKQTDSNNDRTKTNSNLATPIDVHNQVQQHIKQARILYEQAQYQDALNECDKALDLDPENQSARSLKTSINKTMEILNRNQ